MSSEKRHHHLVISMRANISMVRGKEMELTYNQMDTNMTGPGRIAKCMGLVSCTEMERSIRLKCVKTNMFVT